MDAQHTKHVTYKVAYHFVWCPKYRKKLLVGALAVFVKQELHRICEANAQTMTSFARASSSDVGWTLMIGCMSTLSGRSG
jgi:REP element-mobilizing transposase RayT